MSLIKGEMLLSLRSLLYRHMLTGKIIIYRQN